MSVCFIALQILLVLLGIILHLSSCVLVIGPSLKGEAVDTDLIWARLLSFRERGLELPPHTETVPYCQHFTQFLHVMCRIYVL